MTMAMTPAICNSEKRLLSFVGTVLRLQGSKVALTTNGNRNVNGNDSCGGIDMSRDVRRLCNQGRLEEGFGILHAMEQGYSLPDSSTYASLLDACAERKAMAEGKLVHAHMIDTGFDLDTFLSNKLVIMYAKCGSLVDARRIFEDMPRKNVVSWTAMIVACVRYGCDEQALTLYYQMQRECIQPNKFTFTGVLSACVNLAALKHGKEVHGDIIRFGFPSDIFVGSALVDMYAKCGSIKDAHKVFDEMPERNVVSWNALFAGYAQNGHVDKAMTLFQEMPARDVVSWTAIIGGYAQIGQVEEALKLFQKMPERNVVSWTAMITGYARHGYNDEALALYHRMQQEGIRPNKFTFAGVLPACANLLDLKHGKEVHEDITRSGFQSDIFVGSALVDMYAKCGNLHDASQVFDKMTERNVVSWTAMIAGYAQNGQVDEAVKLFQKMPERNAVSWNAMLAGYAQNKQVDEAVKLFQNMPEHDVITWNVIIGGYVQDGHFNEALKLFRQMQLRRVKPDSVTFTSILLACANLAALMNGKEVHENIIRSGLQSHVSVRNALVNMYAKCGLIKDAFHVFDKMTERDIISWNVMIVGFAKHGFVKEALQLFEQMRHSNTKPDHVTFIGVLFACSHAGLVDDGWQYFACMRQDYHITPAVEHYCCMVDLLGRAGHLDEAQNFINRMPMKPDAAVWGSLLGACRIHSNIELGEVVAEHLFELDPKNAAFYVLLSNIYAASGKWDDVEKVRKMMRDMGITKIPGCSWIEVNEKEYSFLL